MRDLRDSLVGTVMEGTDGTPYRIEQCIGTGGQGWVFRARRAEEDTVIVKVLRPDGVDDHALHRFRREADVLRALWEQPNPSPHLVRFYDHRITTLRPPGTRQTIAFAFTVLEYVSGATLGQILEESEGAGLPFARVRRILLHVARGLSAVHALEIIHRDLKPSNVLLANESGAELAKVTDFGLVRVANPTAATTGFLGVTHGYAPPELYEKGAPRASVRSDVFSFAAIAWEMIAGQPLFPFGSSDTPTRHVLRMMSGRIPALAGVERPSPELAARPDLLRRLDEQLSRALAPEPADRFASVDDLVLALDLLPT